MSISSDLWGAGNSAAAVNALGLSLTCWYFLPRTASGHLCDGTFVRLRLGLK